MELDNKKIITVDDGIQYYFETNSTGILQLILQPHKSLAVDLRSVCWSSPKLQLKTSGLFQRIFQVAGWELAQILNESDSVRVCVLSKGDSGTITALSMPSNNVGLYCSKDNFLGVSTKLKIQSKYLPLTIGNHILSYVSTLHSTLLRHYHITGSEGVIFLQSGSNTMKKTLKSGETLIISYSCLVAIEDSCTIKSVQVGESSFIFMVQAEGPGNIYLSASGKKRLFADMAEDLMNRNRHPNPNPTFLFLLFLAPVLIAFVMGALMKFKIYFPEFRLNLF